MIDGTKPLFRWGPIPGYLINVDAWLSIFTDYPSRPHHYSWPAGHMVFHGGKMFYVNELAPLEKVGGEIFTKIILTNRRKKFAVLWKKCVSDLFGFCRNVNPEVLRSSSDNDLLTLWREFNRLLFRFWEPGIIPQDGGVRRRSYFETGAGCRRSG